MNTTTKAGLILNAIKAPYEIFMKLCENYEPEDLFSRGESFWEELEMSKSVQNRLAGIIAKDGWAERELEHAEKLDARFITAKDLDYPEKLRELKKPPVGIYVRGNADILSLPSVAIVGTRKCSTYGHDMAYRCLDFDGRTIAVFGTGLEKTYPAEHKELFKRILERGALITEYPMTSGGEVWRFSERNRIIAALASRVVIVESPEGGGAMKTANLGLELGREVLSVPGRINEDSFRGSNELLNKGTGALTSLEEFINSIAGNSQLEIKLDDNNNNKVREDSQMTLNSDEEKIIYSLIQKHDRVTTDDLLSESGLDFVTIQGVLIELEANGLINGEAGRYSLTVR